MGSTLFSAVKQNCHAVVDILIDGGADVNMFDQQGYTPLLLAAELGHTDTFRYLPFWQCSDSSNIDSALLLIFIYT
jgi:hypothetical protein